MIKSVLVAALSVTLISTGLASGHKKTSGAHSKKAVSSKSSKDTNRKASNKTYNRGRRFVEVKETPRHQSTKNDIGRATVVGVNINVRSAPNSNAAVVTKVSGGNVAIVAQKGDWYKLRFQYGSEGWVREDFLKIAGKASAPKTIPIKLDSTPVIASKIEKNPSVDTKPTVKNVAHSTPDSGLTRYVSLVPKTVNIHKGPSSSNSVSGKVKGGQALIVDKWDDWYKVKFKYGTIGWVKKDYIVFPSNFDFKNSNNKPVVRTKPETVVATRTKPIEKASTPENSVEITSRGEVPVVDSSATAATADSGPKDSAVVEATVIGDRIAVRKGPSTTNSVMTKVNGGKAEIIDKRGDFVQLRFPHGTIGWVSQKFVSYPGHIVKEPEPTYVATNDGGKIDKLMNEANDFRRRGARYSYGSSSRSITDCSGFTLQVFKSVGVYLPRTAREQATRGAKVDRWHLKTGDLIFFNTRGYISHVGIYIGDQHFIHASSGGGRVMESSLNENYYGNRFLFGKRIISESKVKKLDLPNPGETPTEPANQRGNDNTVDISKDQKDLKKDEPTTDPEPNSH